MSKKLGLAASLAGALFLAACGDDGSSGKPASEKDGTASVPTYDDLAHCTKSHYGEIVFVEEESAYFECTSEDWAEVDESKLDSLLAAASSSSEADEDKPKSSSSLKADSTETADVEKVEVDSITVKGFAQKGPFASGTAVTVYGLDSLLEKTKTKFTGKVSGDSGAYSVSKIVLPSQYALVEVSGYYQNEVTGKKTSGSKTTLSALVDLSEGKTVKANVNLFTDLEYARAKHLVLKEKFNVPAAKKRATKELLAIFSGKGDDDLTATALSLSDTTSAGQALLFASILLQGDLSASKFGILLGGIEEFFGSTGGLDSAEATAAFADWASKVDSTDNFAAIRENVKAMKLVATVPDFESALYAFWTKEYGLGACTDSLESTIEKNSNKKSENYGAGYACTAKRWHKATALDTELGLCTGKMEGQFKEYKGGKSTEYYVCKAGSWNKITETQFELKECTESRNLELVKIDKSGSYVCEWNDGVGAWREATELEKELGVCGSKSVKDSTIEKSEESGTFACLEKEWKSLDSVTAELGFCKASMADSVYKTAEGDYYKCASLEWTTSTLLAFEIQNLGPCNEQNNFKIKATATQGNYVCDNMNWRKPTALELEIGVCGDASSPDSTVKKTQDEKYYACLSGKWTKSNEATYLLGYCSSALDDSVRWTGNFNASYSKIPDMESAGKFFECKNGTWKSSNSIRFYYGSVCSDNEMVRARDRMEHFGVTYTASKYKNNILPLLVTDSDTMEYVVCKQSDWKNISQLEWLTKEECTEENDYSEYRNEKGVLIYVCENGDWRESSTVEADLGVCSPENVNTTKSMTFSGTPYTCLTMDGAKYTWYQFIEDERDHQIYPIVEIGNQVWMAKNLNYNYSGSKASDVENMGRSYNFVHATAGACPSKIESSSDCKLTYPFRGICPEGWHLPRYSDWEDLVESIGGKTEAGKLKSTTGWGDDKATDEYGFAALNGSSFWMARTTWDGQYRQYLPWYGYFGTYGTIQMTSTVTSSMFYIRCVKDPVE